MTTQLKRLEIIWIPIIGGLVVATLALTIGRMAMLLFLVIPLFLLMKKHLGSLFSTLVFFYLLIHLSTATIFAGNYTIRIAFFYAIVAILYFVYLLSEDKEITFRASYGYYFLFFILLITMFIGSMKSLTPFLSLQYLIWYFLFIFFIFYLIPNWHKSTDSIINLLYAFLLSGLIFELLSFFTLGSVGITDRGGNIAVRGVFINNNMAGMIAFVTSALSFIVIVHKEYLSRVKLFLVRLSVIISPIFVILSSSRSSILGLVTVVLLIGSANKKTKKLSVFAIFVVSSIFLFGRDLLIRWFRMDTLVAQGSVLGEREILFQYVIDSLPYIPWHGLGIGMQETLYILSPALSYLENQEDTLGFHNSYLQFIVETGIVGFSVFTIILLFTFINFFSTKGKTAKRLNLTLLATLIGMMVSSFFESALLLPGSPYSLIFWTIVCLVHVVHYRDRNYSNEKVNIYKH